MSIAHELTPVEAMAARAQFLARNGGIAGALAGGAWPEQVRTTLAEALVLRMLK